MTLFDILHSIFSVVMPATPSPTQSGVSAPVTSVLSVLPQAIKAVCPNLPDATVQVWSKALVEPMTRAEINTPRRCAAFLGQLVVESGSLTVFHENLNYSASRLMQVWPSRFPTLSIANQYAHNPEALANHVYSNRLGNGNEASGDGWRYRGSGPIQITGEANYAAFGKTVNMDAEQAATFISTPEGGAASACWFWSERNINPLADAWNIPGITQKVNALDELGGT